MPGQQGTVPADPAQQQPQSTATILAALARVYESTLAPDAWPHIMAAISPLVASSKAMFVRVDRTYPRESVTLTHGIAAEFDQALRVRKLDEDHLWRAVLPLPTGAVFQLSEVVSADVWHDGPMYERIARPAGLEYCLGAILENNSQYFSNLCFMRASADFRSSDKELYAALVPHLQAALRISHRVYLGDAGRREALLSFDRARQPVVVLDRSGYAIYTNGCAQRVLSQADGVELKFGRFLFQNVPTQLEFERVLRLAVATVSGSPDIHPVPHEIRVPRRGAGAPFALSVVPATRAADRAVLPDGAGCLVLIFDLERPTGLPLERLTWLYRLTPAEARVCEGLFLVGSIDAVAEHLSLTRNTVRSHLKSIYSKFGIATQGQLMQRLAYSVRLSDGIDRSRPS